ncbi:MAG: class I SAM-dependent methyltransferase [Anaerolineales bacterium]
MQIWADHLTRKGSQQRYRPGIWEDFATRYDEVVPHSPEITAALRDLIRPEDTVLDIGAGTGRFTLPLAAHARAVTALDRSAQMLDALQAKASAQGLTNITTLQATWAEADVEPHDVVLAAFVPGPAQDIPAQLQKMADTARRALIVVQGDPSAHAPHYDARMAIWPDDRRDIPKYLIFAGMLWQIGLRADVRVLHEQRTYQAATREAIARQLAPLDTTDEQISQLAERIAPLMHATEAGFYYEYSLPAGLIIWDRDTT